jgi:hypothetical protein
VRDAAVTLVLLGCEETRCLMCSDAGWSMQVVGSFMLLVNGVQ